MKVDEDRANQLAINSLFIALLSHMSFVNPKQIEDIVATARGSLDVVAPTHIRSMAEEKVDGFGEILKQSMETE